MPRARSRTPCTATWKPRAQSTIGCAISASSSARQATTWCRSRNMRAPRNPWCGHRRQRERCLPAPRISNGWTGWCKALPHRRACAIRSSMRPWHWSTRGSRSIARLRPDLRPRGVCGMKRLVLETTAPFQGLPELVAYDEGLFENEGLIIEWADREKDVEKKPDGNVISPKGGYPFSSHGERLEQGQADMYNACEWGN